MLWALCLFPNQALRAILQSCEPQIQFCVQSLWVLWTTWGMLVERHIFCRPCTCQESSSWKLQALPQFYDFPSRTLWPKVAQHTLSWLSSISITPFDRRPITCCESYNSCQFSFPPVTSEICEEVFAYLRINWILSHWAARRGVRPIVLPSSDCFTVQCSGSRHSCTEGNSRGEWWHFSCDVLFSIAAKCLHWYWHFWKSFTLSSCVHVDSCRCTGVW